MHEFDPQVLQEKPVPPSIEFSTSARVKSLDEYRQLYDRAASDPEGFWAEQAKLLDWFEPYKQVLDWKSPHAKWFIGGKLNVSHNCLDRHVAKTPQRMALIWEAEDSEVVRLTYLQFHERVCRFSNALKSRSICP